MLKTDRSFFRKTKKNALVVNRYLEILEHEELLNIIFTQTVATGLQLVEKARTYRTLRQIIADSRRNCVLFYNEYLSQTYVQRLPGESIPAREWRAICSTADWYSSHLKSQVPILILSEKFGPEDYTGTMDEAQVKVCNVEQFLETHWPNHQALHDLFLSLKDIVLEEKELSIRIQSCLNGKESTSSGSSGARYVEYKSSEEIEAGVKSNVLFKGMLRISNGNRQNAYVENSSSFPNGIMIVGETDRNRAIPGDIVAVELLPESEWTHPSDSIYRIDESSTPDAGLAPQRGKSGLKRPTGRVVGVITRNWRSYVATVQIDAVDQGGSFHLVVPLDPVIPKIRIRHHNIRSIQNDRIVVRIDSWETTSQYPNGHYVRSLGPIHQLDTEISAILVEHNISVSQSSSAFSAASLKEMPINTKESPWKPTQEEIRSRRDIRFTHTVFSIDPPGCQDIDDALSVQELPNGDFEVGVHIADVSSFVLENSATDLEARARGTTVYLADRRFDMLPQVLSEQVCSLRENVDRFAVSVFWILDSKYNIKATSFGQTVIRSAREMAYEQAQALLDGKRNVPGIDRSKEELFRKCIKRLASIFREIRARRFADGALELESTEPLEVHKIVEEAMILANTSVAKKIFSTFKHSAMLRRHPSPVESHFRQLKQAAETRGLKINTSSNATLAISLQLAQKNQQDKDFVVMLKTMATMAMQEAGYISSGSYDVADFYHFGLALEFYTHFTSPIRRYADLVVHRQLLATLASPKTALPHHSVVESNSKLSEIATHLNSKSREAKFASKDSIELFQSLYVMQKSKNGPILEKGIISEIRDNGFFVFVPRFGIKGPVYLKDKDGHNIVPQSLISGRPSDDSTYLPRCSVDSDATRITVTILDSSKTIEFNVFDHVQVSLKLHESRAHRHTVYMTLIGLLSNHQEAKPIQALNDKELMSAIKEGEKKSQANVEPAKDPDSRPFQQSSRSMYELLERFHDLSIVELRDSAGAERPSPNTQRQ
ncbi:RNB-domain-containing protein [Basidiobolus meristosporus CBS 931.73]|uniref:DIS3-like exonuclease 1 n=1 Tax=Basidiobolus meristosporus CBS 931.73 TaxID=1314790 RepID=A0A1Y1XMZ0_9FUNG|nr:RNB-domain-containing protein [Basidiobolus meristosporus CBS 931.73]|eukprot:ORX87083.1 RNB-domain-containing protein [Basidiobolus meristosporus CBS 931.73]